MKHKTLVYRTKRYSVILLVLKKKTDDLFKSEVFNSLRQKSTFVML